MGHPDSEESPGREAARKRTRFPGIVPIERGEALRLMAERCPGAVALIAAPTPGYGMTVLYETDDGLTVHDCIARGRMTFPHHHASQDSPPMPMVENFQHAAFLSHLPTIEGQYREAEGMGWPRDEIAFLVEIHDGRPEDFAEALAQTDAEDQAALAVRCMVRDRGNIAAALLDDFPSAAALILAHPEPASVIVAVVTSHHAPPDVIFWPAPKAE